MFHWVQSHSDSRAVTVQIVAGGCLRRMLQARHGAYEVFARTLLRGEECVYALVGVGVEGYLACACTCTFCVFACVHACVCGIWGGDGGGGWYCLFI